MTKVKPASGPTTGGTRVVLKGRALVNVKKVKFGKVATKNFEVKNPRKVVVTSPAGAAGKVGVRVVTAKGRSKVTAATRFEYVEPVAPEPPPPPTPAPTLSGLSPDTGSTGGGASVTLTGTNLTGATSVTFGGAAATFSVQSATTIVATSPAHTAGAVTVTVTTPGGSATLPWSFSYIAGPTLTAVAPAEGPLSGATVELTGTGITDDAEVRFGDELVDIEVTSEAVTATVPPHAAGTVDVSVTTAYGTATLEDAFTFVAEPTLTGISPAKGKSSGGTTVVLTGTNLRPGAAVTFGGQPAGEVSVNEDYTRLTVDAPAHAAGTVDITVTTAGGSAHINGTFSYLDAPALIDADKVGGPLGGGQPLTLSGSRLEDVVVTFGGVEATIFEHLSPNAVTVITPAHAAGTVDIEVTTPGGSALLEGFYTYVPAPTITSITPDIGLADVANLVTLRGAHLFEADMQVAVGGEPVENLEWTSLTEVSFVIPAGAAGLHDVEVITLGGSALEEDGFERMPRPMWGSVSPTVHTTAGGSTAIVTGEHLDRVEEVIIGVTPASFTVIDPETLAVAIPAQSAGPGSIMLTYPGGAIVRPLGELTFVVPPAITGVDPAMGPAGGGAEVTITGEGLGDVSAVTFGGAPADFTVLNDTTVTATAPVHPAGVVDIELTTPVGPVTAEDAFTFIDAPVVSTITPTVGHPDGGQQITLQGSNLATAQSVSFGSEAEGYVPGTIVSATDTEVVVTVPPMESLATVDVRVATVGGLTSAGDFTYVEAPTVTGLTPLEGPATGELEVTITGTNFVDGQTTVTFGGVPALAVEVLSGTELKAVTPSRPGGGYVNVVVTTPSGAATLVDGHRYIVGPTLTGITPPSDSTVGGAVVTLTGTGFRPGIVVRFGGVLATGVDVQVGGSTLTAIVPAHAAGVVDVEVETPGGTAVLENAFTYLAS